MNGQHNRFKPLQEYEDAILRLERKTWLACAKPPAWAQYRDPLVKGLRWWNSEEDGVSKTTKGPGDWHSAVQYITGLFIGKYAAQNSYLDAEVLITSINGQRSTNTPETLNRRDALKNTFEARKLIGVIIGRGATPQFMANPLSQVRKTKSTPSTEGALFPCPMPKNQEAWVLGYYIVTDIWNARTEVGLEDGLEDEDATNVKSSIRAKKDLTTMIKAEMNGFTQQPEPDANLEAIFEDADDFKDVEVVDTRAELVPKKKARGKARSKTLDPRVEAEKGTVTMLRLERWDIENKTWFAKNGPSHEPPPLPKRDYTISADVEICKTCKQESRRIFEEYFLCHNIQCADNWRIEGKISTVNLTYTKPFLQKRDPGRLSNNFQPPGAMTGTGFPEVAPAFENWVKDNYKNLTPESLTIGNYEAKMKALNIGFLCPSCHMLNRRIKWHAWHCANGDCNYSYTAPPPFLSLQQLAELNPKPKSVDWRKLTVGPLDRFESEQNFGDYMCYNYDLEYSCGLSILVPKPGTNAKLRGADWLYHRVFELAKSGTIALERIITPAGSEGTITNHYIVNYGKPYKLATHIKNTTMWENAPEEITYARNKINELTNRFQIRDAQDNLAKGEGEFNECYIAGYFTDNAMSWHDDGEGGLGSVVATWTLGGEGKMQIGMKTKHMYGRRRQKWMDEDFVLPGCLHETERRVLKDKLEAVYARYPDTNSPEHQKKRAVAQKQWKEAFQALLKDAKRAARVKPHKLLDIPLVHGSIAVMRGARM